MECVPRMISTKDLSYVEDMFKWEYNAYKEANSFIKKIKDKYCLKILNCICNMHYNHMLFLLAILSGDSDQFYKEGGLFERQKESK